LRRQIYDQLPGRQEQLFEIKWSIVTSLIFAISGSLMGLIWQKGWTQLYLKFDQFGWLYFFVIGPALLLFIHDAYFYWTHRLLHQPTLYRKYHAVHHASLKPSGWASFSFHPGESIVNAAAIPLIILFLPLHPVHLLVHLTIMTLTAVTNHSGFEVLPKNSNRHWLGKWLISGVHHTQHHRYFKYNFGLFFSWWDVWFKTEHSKFNEEFDKVFQKS
jgi:sterol desaturase/sphingolipid hydroxylase (fatty acid hydroxylase superfamily)